MKATILLAEDEQAMREVLTDYFTAKSGGDFTVVAAPDGDTALHLIETRRFDLLLLDIMLSLDPERGIVTADGRRIDLPPKEFALLRALMERKNRVLTRDELLNLAWGWDFDGTDRVIDGHIKKLRRALGPHADCIKTVVKRGYKLEVDGDENQT